MHPLGRLLTGLGAQGPILLVVSLVFGALAERDRLPCLRGRTRSMSALSGSHPMKLP